jgi:hypothetical protein
MKPDLPLDTSIILQFVSLEDCSRMLAERFENPTVVESFYVSLILANHNLLGQLPSQRIPKKNSGAGKLTTGALNRRTFCGRC